MLMDEVESLFDFATSIKNGHEATDFAACFVQLSVNGALLHRCYILG